MNTSNYSKQISDIMRFRKALPTDIPEISVILKQAVERMLAEGKQQWDENYPNESHIRSDIDKGTGFVLEDGKAVVAYGAVVFTGEPAYDNLDGEWLSSENYVVVHRLAVSQEANKTGMGHLFMNEVECYARVLGIRSFKIDTNFDNSAMLGLLNKLGFTYCGRIEYENGSRMAFEKLI